MKFECAGVLLLTLRFLDFQPQRGGRKSAQGKRPTGAAPWVSVVKETVALKGRRYTSRGQD